jgi:hypothetical protein
VVVNPKWPRSDGVHDLLDMLVIHRKWEAGPIHPTPCVWPEYTNGSLTSAQCGSEKLLNGSVVLQRSRVQYKTRGYVGHTC